MRTVWMSGDCSLGGMAEVHTMRAHQVPCGLFMRRGAFTLKCDVSGGLTQEITLKETIFGPIDWGATPLEMVPRKRLIVAAARQSDSVPILGFTFRIIELNRQNCWECSR